MKQKPSSRRRRSSMKSVLRLPCYYNIEVLWLQHTKRNLHAAIGSILRYSKDDSWREVGLEEE